MYFSQIWLKYSVFIWPYENKVGSIADLIFIKFVHSSGHIRLSEFLDENKLCPVKVRFVAGKSSIKFYKCAILWLKWLS